MLPVRPTCIPKTPETPLLLSFSPIPHNRRPGPVAYLPRQTRKKIQNFITDLSQAHTLTLPSLLDPDVNPNVNVISLETSMGEAAAATSIFGSIQPFDDDEPPLVRIADHGGDVILAVTFETSEATLRRARKWAPRKSSGTSAAAEPSIVLKPRFTVAYRVSLNALTKQSKYFANLLGNSAFKEAQLIAETYASLSRQGIKPADAEAADLPVIRVTDDDDATRAAGREVLFEDMLRLMHQMPIKNSALVNMPYATTLAILADRFDCTSRVSRAFADIRFKWPVTSNRPYVDEAGRATEVERVLRQKVLTAWLLNQPMQLHQASRELLMRGSRFWGPSAEEHNMTGAWWNLPEGIEGTFSKTSSSLRPPPSAFSLLLDQARKRLLYTGFRTG